MRPIQVMRRGGAASAVSIPVGTYGHYVIDPVDANCTLQFSSNGTCAVSSGVTPPPPPWLSGSTNGAAYDLSTDAGASWLNLGTNRLITVSRTVQGTSTGNFDCRIRPAGGGATLATGIVTLEAIVDA